MEDIRWIIKKYGIYIVILFIAAIIICILLWKKDSDNRVEEVWEPPAEIPSNEPEPTEEIKEEQSDSSLWFLPQVMTTYFPVSISQLRDKCEYDESSNSYQYEMIYASQYPPFGEVVDYFENADGTLTLIVDGVWPDYNSNCAFTNRIVVRPFEDGTFRYMSNSIEQKELELPPIARKNGDE